MTVNFEPEYEGYDTPSTPKISFIDLRTYVAALPTEALRMLALGPIEEERTCRACDALDPLLPVHPSEPPEAQGEVAFAAYVLKEWHDNLSFSDEFSDLIERGITQPAVYHPDHYEYMKNERHEVLGSIMYARCCAIYAAAIAELASRKET